MGCVTSKKDINDIHPHIFQVENVDETGSSLKSGQLEVNETELVFYQGHKPPVRWPLKSLRRYGHDKEYFSFEAGRRCPSGSGVFGFNCRRAEKLFNFVQAYIQVTGEDREGGTPLLQVEPYYLEPRSDSTLSSYLNDSSSSRGPRRLSLRNSSRLSSVGSSNGCTSPSTPNNINDDAFMHPLSEEPEGVTKHPGVIGQPCYENIDIPGNPVYINVDVSRTSLDTASRQKNPEPGRLERGVRSSFDMIRVPLHISSGKQQSLGDESPQHSYANMDLGEVKMSAPSLLTYSRQVDYAVLDLDTSPSAFPSPSPTEIVPNQKEGYVVIDFDRTVALSQSSASSSLEEGVRKTRHDTSAAPPDLVTPTSSATLPSL